jgi:hypothetical protein
VENIHFFPKANQHAQKDRQAQFDHSSFNLASGGWEDIIGEKKKHSSFNRASPWDAGSDGGSSNAKAKGKNEGKKKQASFNWASSSNAGDSDSDDSGDGSNSSASAKGWGKKEQPNGNVNVYLNGCCIFI